jgi:hypothetical protein
MGEKQATAWPEGGEEDGCNSDMQGREERKQHLQGSSGTIGEVIEHEEMRIKGRSKRVGAV